MSENPALLTALLQELRRLNDTLTRWAPPEPVDTDFEQIAFRWEQGRLEPLPEPQQLPLEDLRGIEAQKNQLIQNTRQFLKGLPANNALLWGARGTGKSSLIRALLTAYRDQGLRIIEVDRTQLRELAEISRLVGDRPERFILFFDDLAFEADDGTYKALKAALEGSLAALPRNLLIYATSNRRHLLPEAMETQWLTRHQGTEIHPAEAVEETLSLSERFGLWLSFHPFTQDQYLDIVAHWLDRLGAPQSLEEARTEALAHALLRGSRSGRVAFQFAKTWVGSRRLEPAD
jgi:predicted AAA+ superfamily ATPase